MSLRARVIALVLVCAVAIAGAIVYALTVHAKRKSEAKSAPRVATTNLASIKGAPRIVFRNTALGPDYGKVAMVALADPSGSRAITGTSCDRVYAATQKILCLSLASGIVTTYRAEVLGDDMQSQRILPLDGVPSRARLSADGTMAAITSFTSGDSYAGSSFSTRTVISHLTGDGSGASLEDYRLIDNGNVIKPTDRNYWGVTFASDDNTFFATAAFGGHTHLVKGSVKARTVTTLRTDAECPSLSPDGTTIAYKKRNNLPAGHWRLASYDIATGNERLLAETRSVDDQVDWLDNSHVIYGIPRTESQAAVDDIYSVPTDGSGTPSLLISQAWSPAVVR